MGLALLLQVLLLVACLRCLHGQNCAPVEGMPRCVCVTDDGIIDLTSIASEDGLTLSNPVDPNGYSYFYNPCFGLEGLPTPCNGGDVAICQQDRYVSTTYYKIATLSSEQMVIEGSRIFINYVDDTRTTEVSLICDLSATTPTLTTKGDSGTTFAYEFDLTTNCACPDACPSAAASSSGVGAGIVGIVLIFMFIGGVIAYVVVGSVIMKFHYNKEGSDIIPNKEFWIAFPLLIKGGFMFTFAPLIMIIKPDSMDSTYQNL